MKKLFFIRTFIKFFLSVVFFLPVLAFAHQEADGSGFLAGFTHPIFGLDHLLAMVCVGIVSSQLGGINIWRVPVIFVLAMFVGGLIGIYQIQLPFTEACIAVSVIILGSFINHTQRSSKVILVSLIVFVFGIFHGHAHGLEMPGSSSPVYYTFGFITSTSILHMVGVVIGELATKRALYVSWLRNAGASIAGMGIFMFLQHIGVA